MPWQLTLVSAARRSVSQYRNRAPGSGSGRGRACVRPGDGQGLKSASTFAQGGTIMSILGWVLLGLIAGFIASKIVNKSGAGIVVDIILGIVGAVVGGFIFSRLGVTGVTGFNLYSMFVATIGAVIVLLVYHFVTGHRSA
jgi:uncharacterized membrane protein YeaQ/YmgE (transglycosylase-associated protein family)